MTVKSNIKYNSSREKNITTDHIDKTNFGYDAEKAGIKRLNNKTSNIYEGKLKNTTQGILNNTRKNLSPKSNPTIICKTLSNDTFTVNNRKKFKKSILTLPNKLEKSVPMCDKSNKCEPNNEKERKTNKLYNKRIEVSSNQSSTNLHKSTKKPSKNNSGKNLANTLGDVWTILNNIDAFKVVPTPIISEASFSFNKKTKNNLSKRTKLEVKPFHKVDNEIKVIYSPDSSVSSSITAVIASTKYRRKAFGQENKFTRKINKSSKIEDGIKSLKNNGKGHNSTSFKENANKSKNRIQPAAKSTSEVVSSKLKNNYHASVIKAQKPMNTKSISGKAINMTVAEIKNKVAQLKFPIIILGKDELSSTVHVEKYEPPQFRGLNKQIWPFMKDWSIETVKESREIMEPPNRPMSSNNAITNVNSKNRNRNNEIRLNTFNVKTERKYPIKPLIKKTSGQKVQEINKKECFKDLNKITEISACDASTMDIGDETVMNSKKQYNDAIIDKIILKIEEGVYYNNVKSFKREPRRQLADKRNSGKIANLKNEQPARKHTVKEIVHTCANFNKELLLSIPGFEDCFSDIRLEEISRNQVIVTHSRTKVSLEFIADELWSDISDNCIPLKAKNNVYTFPLHINMESLPENLCSMIPNLINNILHDSSSYETLDKVQSSAEVMKLKEKISKLQSQFSLSCRDE